MNHVITIGREFGSGGRELGKRLSELLGFAYYDKEIIEEISKRTQLAEGYVKQIVEQRPGIFFPITIGHTLHTGGADYMVKQYSAVYAEQANVLHEMAQKSDCIIVGRCGDFILQDLNPLRIFVYSNMESKMARCREKATVEEHLSDRALRRRIREIDKNRAKYYRYYTGQAWGNRSNYDICVNTSEISVKKLAASLAALIKTGE